MAALATPNLWRLLCFNGERAMFEQSKAHVERSGTKIDLHVYVDFSDKDGNPTSMVTSIENELQRTFDLVTPVVDRWRTFHIAIPGNEHVDVVLKRLYECKAASRLQNFAIAIHDENEYEVNIEAHGNTPRPLFSGRTPLLVDVSIVSVPLRW